MISMVIEKNEIIPGAYFTKMASWSAAHVYRNRSPLSRCFVNKVKSAGDEWPEQEAVVSLKQVHVKKLY